MGLGRGKDGEVGKELGAHSISSVQLGRGGGGNLRVSYSDSFSFASGVGSNASEMRSGKG